MITPRQARDLKARRTLDNELQELDRLINLVAPKDNKLTLRELAFSQEALNELINLGYQVNSRSHFIEVEW